MPVISENLVCEFCSVTIPESQRYVFQCSLCGERFFCSLECAEDHQTMYEENPCGDGDPAPDVPSNFTNYGTTTVAAGGTIRVIGSAGAT
jgi:predicted RNA-binding Zn-ribbon protein involved in translation (DUF1610 family)